MSTFRIWIVTNSASEKSMSPNGDMNVACVRHASLADTKAAEDLPQQIIAGEFAGDFAQGKLCASQFFSEELKA